MGNPFHAQCHALDTNSLRSLWHEQNLLSLPNDFDWTKLGKRYVKKVKAIIQDSSELRAILDSKNLEKSQKTQQRLLELSPNLI